jgi:hypothetical protein
MYDRTFSIEKRAEMPDQRPFDVTQHLNQEVGWAIIFPATKDWTVEPTQVLVNHLKEVSDTFKLVASMRGNSELHALNVRYRTIQHLAVNLDRHLLHNIAHQALKYAERIDGYIRQLEAS